MTNNRNFALVTGATCETGYEFARMLAQKHYNLVLVAQNRDLLENMAEEFYFIYDVKVLVIQKDLNKTNAPVELCKELQEKGINVEVLINVADHTQFELNVESGVNRQIAFINLQLMAYVVLCNLFLQDMIARNKGIIWNIIAVGKNLPSSLESVSQASVAFITSFTENLQKQCQGNDISISSLFPENITFTQFQQLWRYQFAQVI